jgi:hypothetical protein
MGRGRAREGEEGESFRERQREYIERFLCLTVVSLMTAGQLKWWAGGGSVRQQGETYK